MKLKHTGTVTSMPKILDNRAVYEIDIDGEEYTVESGEKQAVKDYLFIRKGQNLEVEGDISDNRIEVQKAKIDIIKIISSP